jgi:hypothetical protein
MEITTRPPPRSNGGGETCRDERATTNGPFQADFSRQVPADRHAGTEVESKRCHIQRPQASQSSWKPRAGWPPPSPAPAFTITRLCQFLLHFVVAQRDESHASDDRSSQRLGDTLPKRTPSPGPWKFSAQGRDAVLQSAISLSPPADCVISPTMGAWSPPVSARDAGSTRQQARLPYDPVPAAAD